MKPAQGRIGSNANPDQRGNRGDSNVTILLLGEPKSQDRGSSGDEVRRKVASLRDAGTEQSEPGTGEKKDIFGCWTTHQEVD